MSNISIGEGSVQELKIISNYSGDLNLTDGFLKLMLYESILSYTVFAELSFVDTGYRLSGSNNTAAMERDDVNLVSGEKVFLKVTDGNGQIINCKDNNHLRVNCINSVDETVNKEVISLDLYSKECFDNELIDNRVVARYDGKISDSVNTILKTALKTSKNIDIDTTLNELSFIGHVEKPFYKIPWLAKRSVPDIPGSKGNMAGYFFYETFDDGSGSGGYRFKSIDKLWSQAPKRKLIYNEKISTPVGYTGSILAYSFDNTVKVDTLLKTGALASSVIERFDPLTNKFNKNTFNDIDRLKPANMGGLEPPKIASDIQNKASRISYRIDDTGVLPPGTNLKNQLNFVDKINFNTDEIIRQSYTRYNNLFNVKLSITIAGDFGIHAGDLVECHFPEVSSKDKTVVSNKKSGLYMVVDVGHIIEAAKFYTTLHLARESVYKK
jgi:hypothetical protein